MALARAVAKTLLPVRYAEKFFKKALSPDSRQIITPYFGQRMLLQKNVRLKWLAGIHQSYAEFLEKSGRKEEAEKEKIKAYKLS